MRLLSFLGCLILSSTSLAADDPGFVPLFNGKDLTGWEIKENHSKVPEDQLWRVTDSGILKGAGGAGWLGTKGQFDDFVLKIEWRIPEGGNSGVFLRVPGVKEGMSPSQTGLEIQILDDNAPAYKGKLKPYQYSGSIYTFVPASTPVFRGANQWNSFAITCQGEQISVVYNGTKVAEGDGSRDAGLGKRPKKGFIGLQNHGSPVEFRNIRIKILSK